MLTALLLLTTLLLALSGLALMVLENAYSAFKTEYDSLLEEAAQDDATIDQLTTENQELQAKFVELKSIYWNRCRELNSELQTTKHDAYHREQELLNALEDATRAADDNEWLYNDAKNDFHEAVAELAELQEVHKATIEGYSTAEAEQAAEIAELNKIIEEYQTDIHHKVNRISDLKKTLKQSIDNWDKAAKEGQAARNTIAYLHDAIRLQQDELNNTRYKLNQKNTRIEDLTESLDRVLDYWNIAASKNREARNELAAVKEELAETKTLADNLMTDRIEAIAHMKEQNEKIAELELQEFFDSCEDLDEAIEAAAPQEDIIHLDGNKVWTAIGNWTRLIVYKSSPYHCYIQKAIDGPTKRLAAADLTEAQRTTFKALKTAVKFI